VALLKLSLKRLHALWFAFWFLLVMLVLFPFIAFNLRKKAGYERAHRLRRLWSIITPFLAGMVYKRVGEAPWKQNGVNSGQPGVLIANHSSYFDIPALLVNGPPKFRFMAKIELAKIPVFGLLFRSIDIAVDRKNVRASVLAYREALASLREGWSVMVFPEGTIGDDAPTFSDFKEGAFQMAIEAQVPIWPVVLPDNFKRLHPQDFLQMTPGVARCIYLPAISTAGLTKADIPALKAQCFQDMQATFVQAQGKSMTTPLITNPLA
jgi:1-acyl-sn-glycerol-3-phosphate acyltransferase